MVPLLSIWLRPRQTSRLVVFVEALDQWISYGLSTSTCVWSGQDKGQARGVNVQEFPYISKKWTRRTGPFPGAKNLSHSKTRSRTKSRHDNNRFHPFCLGPSFYRYAQFPLRTICRTLWQLHEPKLLFALILLMPSRKRVSSLCECQPSTPMSFLNCPMKVCPSRCRGPVHC